MFKNSFIKNNINIIRFLFIIIKIFDNIKVKNIKSKTFCYGKHINLTRYLPYQESLSIKKIFRQDS